MGAEITCAATIDGKTAKAKARLETNVLQLRGQGVKLDVPFAAMQSVTARHGTLSVRHAGGRLTLSLGEAAGKWAEKILHPPSRLSKLGVKPDWRAAIVGRVEPQFVDELKAAVAKLSVGAPVKEADAIFLIVSGPDDFKHLAALKSSIKPAGAVWLIRPKGSDQVTEQMVMTAGKAAGLVDVKVVGFSATHSALKFVIPVKDRRLI